MCTKKLLPKAENSLCSQLNPTNKDQSIFKQCIEADSERAIEAYASCLYDFCATHNDSIVGSIICGDLDSYAQQCSSLGLSIQWRTQSRCPLSCQQNAEYNASMSAGQPTCFDPKANEKGTRHVVEGCQCQKGYILSNTDCVPESQCGCKYNGEYIPIGTEIHSPDCTNVTKYQLGENGRAELQTKNRPSCGTNTICKPVEGHYQCVCKPGTEGDPLTKCQALSCPNNSHFKHLMTSCPATCTEREAYKNCKLEPREGCECDQGYILSDRECVPIAECGCKTDDGQYIPVGKKIDKPCDRTIECVFSPGESIPKIVSTTAKCKDKCHVGWIYFGNSCYKFQTDQKTWDNAQNKCNELGAYLTEVESKDETEFLQGLVGPKQGYWLGGKDDIKEGNWYWAHSGVPFNFTHWNGGEPNQVGNEDCLQLWYDSPHNWNDYYCYRKENYICERRLNCPEGMKLFKNSCYKFSTDKQTWSEAKETCKNIGGELAEVESKEESDYLQKITAVGPARAYWLGGTDIVTEGEWKWVTSGRTFNFTSWDDNEPNDLEGKENCLHLFSITKWNDSNCDGDAYYIYEL